MTNTPELQRLHEAATHELKILPEFFDAVVRGDKKAELRKADRDFKVGDVIRLCEFGGDAPTWEEPAPEWDYTGRTFEARITHILTGWCIEEGYAMLSFEPIATGSLIPAERYSALVEVAEAVIKRADDGLINAVGSSARLDLSLLRREVAALAALKEVSR